jgi:hypothetical protein
MVANGRKPDWREHEQKLLEQLRQKLQPKEMKWLESHVKLGAPDLDTVASLELPQLFPGSPKEPPPRINDARLIKTFIWQCWVKIGAGLLKPVRGNVRSFWYQFLEGFYRKHGLLPTPGGFVRWRDSDAPEDRIIEQMTKFFSDFVWHHVFWYRAEFRFQEPINDKKRRGVDRPGILFFTEKEGLWWLCEELYDAVKRSVSVMASNGQTSLLNLEYFAAELSKKSWKLSIGAMCDLEPYGEAIAGALDQKMRHLLHGLAAEEALLTGRKPPKIEVTTWLLTDAQLFTPAQIAAGKDLSWALQDPEPGQPDPLASPRTQIRHWLARTGGVDGKPIALHVDVVDEELKRKRAGKDFVDVLLKGKKPKFPTINPGDWDHMREVLVRDPELPEDDEFRRLFSD